MPLTVKELSSERDMMEKQKGAALIVVMSLLAVSLTLGLMNMQTSQIDERLAGNYRAAAQAQMNAEMAAARAMDRFEDDKNKGKFSWEDVRGVDDFDRSRGLFGEAEAVNSVSGSDRYAYEFMSDNGEVYWVLAQGAVIPSGGGVVARSEYVQIRFELRAGSGSGGEGEDERIGLLLKKAVESGGLINVLDDFVFSGSANQKVQDWQEGISSDVSLFDSPGDACSLKEGLLNGSIAGGLVEELSAGVGWQDMNAASGNIVVVKDDGFRLPNNSDFSGVLLIFGRDFKIAGGGNVDFNGAIIHVPVNCEGEAFETPVIDVRGGNGEYNLSAVQSIIDQLDLGGQEGPSEANQNSDLRDVEWQWGA